MPRALISLGSNLGDRRRALDDAVAAVGRLPQTTVVAQSSWHETMPVGGPPGQQPFLNGAIVVDTGLAPERLLAELMTIETALGRVREVPWGPRTIDLDLLLYDDVVLQSDRLTLPHPRLAFRKFVLRGATEVAGEWRHPVLGRTLAELAAHLGQAPRYAALVGRSQGFRSQLAAEAAEVGRARLVEATAAGILPGVEEFHLHGQTKDQAIEFLAARVDAVRRSLSEANGAWIVDDAWPAVEAMELWKQLDWDKDFGNEIRRRLSPDVMPRLIVSLDAADALQSFRRTAPDLIKLPPVVSIHISDREAALTEIAAALDAAA